MMRHLHASPRHPSRVVVLGASGFVGGDLVRHLTGAGIATVGLSSADVDLCQGQAIDTLRQTVRHDDMLVITSALTPDRGKDVGTFMKNVTMGSHLAACFQQTRCAHVVYVSSDAVYADAANPVQERSICDPSSLHGLMHLARERILAHALAVAGTPLLVLRPCPVYGPGDPHHSYGPNRFLRTARAEGRIELFGEGEEQRDHVYIKDLSRLIVECLTHRSVGLLNVATGRSVSFACLARMVAAACEGPVQMTARPRQAPVTHRFFHIAACRRAFPSFRYTPLEVGLAETVSALADQQGSATGSVMAEAGQSTRGGAA